MAPTNMIKVIDISSDEEDGVVKRPQTSTRNGQKPMRNHSSTPRSVSQTTILADRECPNAGRIPARCQSTSTSHVKVNHELPQKRASSEPGRSKLAPVFIMKRPLNSLKNVDKDQSSRSKNPGNASTEMYKSAPLTQEPSSQPPKAISLKPSEQASTSPPTRKRKPTNLAPDPARKRAKPTPAPPLPHRPPEQPSVPTVSNIDLWSVPQYQEPITIGDNAPDQSPDMKSHSVPKMGVPIAKPTCSQPLSTVSPPSSASLKSTASLASQPRPRRTMWTCAQLANFATALDTALDVDGFAAANSKTPQQVKETLGFLVMKPIFEYAEEGQKIARKFHKEMKEHQKETEKVMRKVHRREKREGHWGAEGMPAKEEKRKRAKEKTVVKEKEERKGNGKGEQDEKSGGKMDVVKGKRKRKGPLEMALAGQKKEKEVRGVGEACL